MCELAIKIAALGELKESTGNRFPTVKTFFWFLIVLAIFYSPLFAQQDSEQKKVLLLASYSPTVPVAPLWYKGIRSVFDTSLTPQIKIDIEHLYHHRIQDHHYSRLLVDLYHYKYATEKPDLIIAIYSAALDFALKHGSDLFQDIPIIFGGIDRQSAENRSFGANVYGIINATSYRETLDLALTLHPNTRHVAIVAGVDFVSRQSLREAEEIYRSYEKRFTFIDLAGLSMEETQKKIANLPPETIVIFIMLLKDGDGKEFTAVEATSLISLASNAPIYSFQSHQFGHGMVGGYLSDVESKGKALAELGLRVLTGGIQSDQRMVQKNNYQLKFDWRQLQRWSIREDKLPPGSIVEFKELTVWDRYKGQIIGAVSLIIFQTLIILFLLHQRRLRRQTEDELKDRLQFERKLSELSSEFINLTSENLDSNINDALAWIGPFMQADRTHMFRFNWDRTEFRITHLWEAEGTKKDEIVLPGLVVKETFPWLFDNLIGGRDVNVRDIEMLPTPEAGNEYQYCREMGIQSFIILPIVIENAPLCAIGLDSICQKKEWSQEAQDRLRIIGEIIANTIVRRHAEKKSEEAALRYRTVADFTYDWEYWQNPDGSLQYISPSCERICGYSAQDLMTNPGLLQDMIVPEDKAAWEEHRCSIQKEKPSEGIQFRIQKPDGEIRWIEHACQPVFDHQGNYQGVRASNRDVTKREFYKSETHQLQTELAHMDRVVTISTLTAALAHEINQPLAAMRSYAQAALRFMDKVHPEYDSVRKALQGIVADNKRAADVVNRLRNLVKKGSAHQEAIKINSIINDVIGLINSELVLRNASISLNLHPDVPVVQGDSIQVQQVLMNLLTNALDAMDAQPIDARTIVISTRPENSNQILVSISDSGGGIPPDTIEAIFSPFHTTKISGMGLGLSICKSIIEAHGGRIWAQNNPDGGAIFSFILPVDRK
ncbi:MAG: PAS domain-containing protein [Deltaproteobacteria bacterium]|nr:PAS domain-containing protein [Deltaproteobacteria bacterium]